MAGSLLHGNSNYTIKFKQAKKKVLRATIFFPLNGTAYKFLCHAGITEPG